MTFTDSIKVCFGKYATFAGRASRSEYWWFTLFLILASIAVSILDAMLFGFGENDPSPFSTTFSVATFIPSISVTVRRLHDKNRSGWWWWLALLPIIGWIVLFYWTVTMGTKGDNDFGPEPDYGPLPKASPQPRPDAPRQERDDDDDVPPPPHPPAEPPQRASTVDKRHGGPTIRRQ